MSCWALIPLKTPGCGKTRLRSKLSSADRKELAEVLLTKVLNALVASRLVDKIAIVTTSAIHCPTGVVHIVDPETNLNDAITHGSQQLATAGAEEMLVIHADLPLIQSNDIDTFIAAGRRQKIALASDHHGTGTNAIYLNPLDEFRFNFGRNSFKQHCLLAKRLGLTPALNQARGLQFDLDTLDDLEYLQNEVLTPKYLSSHQVSPWSTTHG